MKKLFGEIFKVDITCHILNVTIKLPILLFCMFCQGPAIRSPCLSFRRPVIGFARMDMQL